MNEKEIRRISKRLSLALRHRPEQFGLSLDRGGWCSVTDLLAAFSARSLDLDRERLGEVVENNDKKRFAFSEDGRRIRASQGHSIDVDLGYAPTEPPERLYHGTAGRNLSSIRREGLHRGARHHVHLSPDPETARRVGQRHGKPVVLAIRTGDMHREGHVFFQSANGVWLTEAVPVAFIEFSEEGN